MPVLFPPEHPPTLGHKSQPFLTRLGNMDRLPHWDGLRPSWHFTKYSIQNIAAVAFCRKITRFLAKTPYCLQFEK
jgi:hypothetical protein